MIKKEGNKVAWDYLFEAHNILEEVSEKGYYKISAEEIKKSNREPRLMTKFDSCEDLPDIFKNNELSILPISKGSYIIGKFENYKDIEIDNTIEVETVFLPNYIKAIDPNIIHSEAISLNASYISKMIEKTISDSSILPTIQGRMSTSDFKFNILLKSGEYTRIEVRNSQMEIDGAYEGKEKFVIIEAKNRYMSDFIIRQLYYPYRYWKSRINKKIIPIMLIKHNDIFNFFVYQFKDEESYNSIELKYVKRFIINERFEKISIKEIKKLLFSSEVINKRSDIPFPQANLFERVLDFYDVVGDHSLSLKEIAELYDFDIRQAHYYSSAAKYIGLVKKESHGFILTPLGMSIKNLKFKERMIEIIKQIIQHKPFRIALIQYLENGNYDKEKIIDSILSYSPNIKKYKTAKRRTQTVISWTNWIIEFLVD